MGACTASLHGLVTDARSTRVFGGVWSRCSNATSPGSVYTPTRPLLHLRTSLTPALSRSASTSPSGRVNIGRAQLPVTRFSPMSLPTSSSRTVGRHPSRRFRSAHPSTERWSRKPMRSRLVPSLPLDRNTAPTPRRRSGLRLQRCSTDRCPEGFRWTPVNRAVAAPTCICTWACKPSGSSGGPSLEDPNRPRRVLPSPRRGTGAPIQRGLGADVYCGCHPLRDSEGNIIGTDIGAPADFDVHQAMPGRTGRAIGELGGRQTTPPPTEAPRPAVVGPAQAGTRPAPPSRPPTTPRPQGAAPPPEPPQTIPPPESPRPSGTSEPPKPAGVPEPPQPLAPPSPPGTARPPAPKPLTKGEYDRLSWRERQEYLDAWMKSRGEHRADR